MCTYMLRLQTKKHVDVYLTYLTPVKIVERMHYVLNISVENLHHTPQRHQHRHQDHTRPDPQRAVWLQEERVGDAYQSLNAFIAIGMHC